MAGRPHTRGRAAPKACSYKVAQLGLSQNVLPASLIPSNPGEGCLGPWDVLAALVLTRPLCPVGPSVSLSTCKSGDWAEMTAVDSGPEHFVLFLCLLT